MLRDARIEALARVLISHSTRLGKGDRVLIELFDAPDEVGVALIRAARAAGAVPFVQVHQAVLSREIQREAEREHYEISCAVELARMKKMTAYIAVRGSRNISEMSDVPEDRARMAAKMMRPVLDQRINHTKWVVLRWPTPSMAQLAGMSTEAFADFFFEVCAFDYGRMARPMEALRQLMATTDRVHITGPGTDLRFSIRGIGAVACGGQHNLPDGEVFSCPVRDSVEGHVTFNAPTIYQGTTFDGIRLEFRKGRIVKAEAASHAQRLEEILNSDAGARYIGEFAIGFHPLITRPMRDILFDEKIAGSFHFTPGQAYEVAGNGNRSCIHWDLVCIQRSEYGGGEIRFDGKLIRKDGLFLPPALQGLNPERLLASHASPTRRRSGRNAGKAGTHKGAVGIVV